MKFSKFNIVFDYKTNIYITNTLTKSIMQIDEKIKKVLKDNKIDDFSQEEINIFKSKGFVINSNIDEIGLLRYRSNKLKNSKKEMEFVICPTLECNFKCTYCFESSRKGYMNENVQNKVLKFIFEKTHNSENEKIHIVWFGGEPLLYPDILLKMNEEIFTYCKENKKELRSDIITNGYLLNEKLIDRLVNSHIDHLQITIDGSKTFHDARRVLKNGLGTYDKIYNNLELLKDKPITVSLRMNIDKNNLDSISELENDIKKLNNSNICTHPAIVELSSNHFNDIKDNCFHDNNGLEFYYNHPEISKYYDSCKCSDYGLRLFFCEAEHANSFVIDEIGNVYKCWNSIGNDDEIYCTVDNHQKNPAILSTYLARDPFTEKDCIDCPYIPICAGGCVMQRKLHNKNFCSESRFNYLKTVKNSIDVYNEKE